ncbi:TPA: MFS transporter, partial [Streptococcus suis]
LIPLFSKYSVSIFFYYIIAFLLPLFSTLFQTGFSVITPALFEKKELQKYNSQFQGVRTISKLISPALAGLLMLKFNINSIFFINSASFLLLFLSILISYIPNQVKKEDGNDDMKEIFTGFKENFTNIRLRVSLLFTIVVNIAMLGFNATIVYYLQDQLKLSNSLVGLVYSIAGFGSLIAVTILSTYLKKKRYLYIDEYINDDHTTCYYGKWHSRKLDIFWNLLFNLEWIDHNSFCINYNNTATRKY